MKGICVDMNFFDKYDIAIGEKTESPFMNKFDVYQDGTTPMYRDVDGKLWAITGHSHMGRIGMFSGTSLDDMKLAYYINTNFCVGHADYAFSGVRYPDGIKPRGSIWPFGLYICPNTHRFFCFFHNESGWNGKGTAYDSFGLCKKPAYDSDFRHIGLMHSDDEGKNWTFDRWVLTAEHVSCTENYIPDGQNIKAQKPGIIGLGSGDFSCFIEPDGEYIYIFYNIVHVNMDMGYWEDCDVYLARTRKRTDGIMGDFVKYYNGSFCEAGNFGKETAITRLSWHPRVTYSKKYDKFFMSSSRIHPHAKMGHTVEDVMEVRTSDDMIHWSEPVIAQKDGSDFGNHYVAMVSDDTVNQPNVIEGETFSILSNHNGTDVLRFPSKFIEK